MQALKSHSSEIVLVLILIILSACSRIYYGGEQGFMIVWKGELSFPDTIVSLEDMIKLPQKDLLAAHRSVYYQLEDMGLLENSDQHTLEKVRRKKETRTHSNSAPNSFPAPTQDPSSDQEPDTNKQGAPTNGETAPPS